MKKVNGTICIDCGAEKQTVNQSGSLQCDGCQEKLFARMRGDVEGLSIKTMQEQVIELTKKGLSAKEVSKKLGITTNSVYSHRYNARKEGEKKVAKVAPKKKMDKKTDERVKKLEQINKNHLDMLDDKNTKIAELNQSLEVAETKVKSLEQAYDELDDKLVELQDELDESAKLSAENQGRNESEYNFIKSENDNLRELLYKREQRIRELHENLDAERTKHKHLRSYSLLIMQEEGAARAE